MQQLHLTTATTPNYGTYIRLKQLKELHLITATTPNYTATIQQLQELRQTTATTPNYWDYLYSNYQTTASTPNYSNNSYYTKLQQLYQSAATTNS